MLMKKVIYHHDKQMKEINKIYGNAKINMITKTAKSNTDKSEADFNTQFQNQFLYLNAPR